MATTVYSLAEQMHQHYCLTRGIVNHNESRPDQDIALSVLGSLAATDWWLVRDAYRLQAIVPDGQTVDLSLVVPNDPT